MRPHSFPSALLTAFFSGLCMITCAQTGKHTSLADSLYKTSGNRVMWHKPGGNMTRFRASFRRILDSAAYYGLDKNKYPIPSPLAGNETDAQLLQIDKQFTRALANFVEDLYCGSDIVERHIKNDELTGRYKQQTDSFLLSWLQNTSHSVDGQKSLTLPEPPDPAYIILKNELKTQLDSRNVLKIAQLTESINIYRWIKHFRFNRYIVVNIPSATLSLFSQDTVWLKMKVVVGKPATRTPRFASRCDKVILYPYWNVPESIARKELLPVFKRSPAKVRTMNMQILNKNGKIVDPHSIQWSLLSSSYFPYTVRQCTGCDNALGVIKYNLTDPFSVYMHDTNYKLAFSSDQRYFSHGCIRLEQPVALGNALLNNKLDSNFLRACLKNQEPITIDLATPIPVFVVYLTAVADTNSVSYYRDIYHLVR